ncbi:hypothetical protein FG386_003056 [Cryptosporidium ryanae]|uniref:uncharacterized protein n=1 Tax=Cryptosporidium ryanae TaxID=515981 RepID=UPI003519E2FF|nr:hypothetical protein FG386_003056 [Cryptosporidium ryanae]
MRANNSNREFNVKKSKVGSGMKKRNEGNSSDIRGRSITPNKNAKTNDKNGSSRTKSKNIQQNIIHGVENEHNHHHHHNLHPTRCLRGVSTRSTYKRSPSPRRDWPFDESILYPPHPRKGLHTLTTGVSATIKQKVKANSERVNKNSSLSPSPSLISNPSRPRSPSPVSYHSPHPTRCLRGVSTRATYKRSPSPRKDWPFDESILYPPHPRESSPKSIGHKRVNTEINITPKKKRKVNDGKDSMSKKTKEKSTVRPRINTKICKVNINKKEITSPKMVIKRPSKNTKSPINFLKKRNDKKQSMSKVELPIIDKRFCKNYDFDTESVATVLDGEESFELSPITGLHVGWGGNALKNSWMNRLSGDVETRISSALLWNENHRGSVFWRPHKCINEYRLVSNSRIHFNPYNNSSITQIGEYIWQTNLDGNKKTITEYPSLFELLFVKKDSLLGSIFNRFCSNPSSHDVIFRELLTQSQFKLHRNILRINEIFQCETFPYTTFVMEYLPHSCMNWDENIGMYVVPSVCKGTSNKLNRIYTSNGARLIFSQVLEAYRYLHSNNISGIYICPESVKISHSLDETYFDKKGNTLTRLLLSKNNNYNRKTDYLSKVNINTELVKYWENSKQISISESNYTHSIRKICDMIQSKKNISTIPSKDMYIFKLENYSVEGNDDNWHMNLEYYPWTCDEEKTNDDLHVKLNYIFKGRLTNSTGLLFAGNKWLNPPELYQSFFYREKENYVNFTKSDIWNLGVFLHCLLSGRVPSLVNNEVVLDKNVPFEIRDLLFSMLQINPKDRITLNGILNSKWLLSEAAF